MVRFFPMKHFILLAYILIFSTGFASLAGLAVLALRLSHPFIKRMMLVQSLFIANLALVAGYYYAKQVMDLVGTTSSVDFTFAVIATLLNLALYGSLVYLLSLHSFRTAHKGLSTTALALCLTTMAIQLLHLASALFSAQALTSSGLWSVITYLVVGCAMLSLGLLLRKSRKKDDHPALRTLYGGIGLSCLLFVPLGAMEYVLGAFTQFAYQPLSLEYLMYLLINTTILIAAAKVLAKQPQSGSAFGELTPDTAKRFLLTAREQEMASLIAQGLTNKEIAFRLGISEATVRTHIYNLFQKVGVQSRIELLNVLHQ